MGKILAVRLLACTMLLSAATPAVAQTVRDIAFPTLGTARLTDSFGDIRGGGHVHEGEDIMGEKMMPLYAAVDGRVRYIVDPEESWGYAMVLEDADDYAYHYLHINNDTPGTDDGDGGTAYAYAAGIERRAPVFRGQLIGWMGDSGNAENVGAHLHFEIRQPGGVAIDPYPSLLAAKNAGSYGVSDALASSPDISTDKSLAASAEPPPCVAGSRVKLATSTSVYYCGADGRRYVFPNSGTYATWYKDFTGVTTVTPEQLAAIRIGGNVTYRPGMRMVKITTDPKVYAVERGGTLRWIQSAEVAAALYGAEWAKKVDDVPDTFFTNYVVGEPVLAAR